MLRIWCDYHCWHRFFFNRTLGSEEQSDNKVNMSPAGRFRPRSLRGDWSEVILEYRRVIESPRIEWSISISAAALTVYPATIRGLIGVHVQHGRGAKYDDQEEAQVHWCWDHIAPSLYLCNYDDGSKSDNIMKTRHRQSRGASHFFIFTTSSLPGRNWPDHPILNKSSSGIVVVVFLVDRWRSYMFEFSLPGSVVTMKCWSYDVGAPASIDQQHQ